MAKLVRTELIRLEFGGAVRRILQGRCSLAG
jgi:hypothetical protein